MSAPIYALCEYQKERREKTQKTNRKIFENIMAVNVPKLMKNFDLYIQEPHHTRKDKFREPHPDISYKNVKKKKKRKKMKVTIHKWLNMCKKI